MYAVNGILFNHESPRRGETFVTRKITAGGDADQGGLQDKLFLGNLDAKRDWGFAGDYVEAMWLMLQQERPQDYVIATGETHSVREFLDEVFGSSDLDWKQYVEVDPALLPPRRGRPAARRREQGPQGARLAAAGDVQGAGEDDDRRRLAARQSASAWSATGNARRSRRRCRRGTLLGDWMAETDVALRGRGRRVHSSRETPAPSCLRLGGRHRFATFIFLLLVFVLVLRLAWAGTSGGNSRASWKRSGERVTPSARPTSRSSASPDGENAWLVLMQAAGAMKPRVDSPRASVLEYPNYPPLGATWEKLAAAAEQAHAPAFVLARQARRHSRAQLREPPLGIQSSWPCGTPTRGTWRTRWPTAPSTPTFRATTPRPSSGCSTCCTWAARCARTRC
jgi:hypothetical protein